MKHFFRFAQWYWNKKIVASWVAFWNELDEYGKIVIPGFAMGSLGFLSMVLEYKMLGLIFLSSSAILMFGGIVWVGLSNAFKEYKKEYYSLFDKITKSYDNDHYH